MGLFERYLSVWIGLAIVTGQFGDEGWSPGGRKAAAGLDGGQTAEGCVHENWLAVAAEHDFVGFDITGCEAGNGLPSRGSRHQQTSPSAD